MVEKRERGNPLKWVGLIFLGLIILNAFKEALKDPNGYIAIFLSFILAIVFWVVVIKIQKVNEKARFYKNEAENLKVKIEKDLTEKNKIISEKNNRINKIIFEKDNCINQITSEKDNRIDSLIIKQQELVAAIERLKGFHKSNELSDEDLILFKEIKLEKATQTINEDSFEKILVRNNGNFLSRLKTDISLFCNGKSKRGNKIIDYEDYNHLTFNEFLYISKKIDYFSTYNNQKDIYNVVEYSENLLYKYEIFKIEHYPKIKIDLEIIAKVEDAKQHQLLKNLEEETKQASRYIPQKVKDIVWNRDGGKCVECGSNEKLEFDHIVPFSKGGANTPRNLQLLCEKCNIAKSNKIG